MNPFSCCSPDVFKAMAEPNRLTILGLLAASESPLSASQIVERFELDQSVVSRHLTQLKHAGLIEFEKKGRQVFYVLAAKRLSSMLRQVADCLDSCACCKRTPENKSKPNRSAECGQKGGQNV